MPECLPNELLHAPPEAHISRNGGNRRLIFLFRSRWQMQFEIALLRSSQAQEDGIELLKLCRSRIYTLRHQPQIYGIADRNLVEGSGSSMETSSNPYCDKFLVTMVTARIMGT